jgi:hypothetical protein
VTNNPRATSALNRVPLLISRFARTGLPDSEFPSCSWRNLLGPFNDWWAVLIYVRLFFDLNQTFTVPQDKFK